MLSTVQQFIRVSHVFLNALDGDTVKAKKKKKNFQQPYTVPFISIKRCDLWGTVYRQIQSGVLTVHLSNVACLLMCQGLYDLHRSQTAISALGLRCSHSRAKGQVLLIVLYLGRRFGSFGKVEGLAFVLTDVLATRTRYKYNTGLLNLLSPNVSWSVNGVCLQCDRISQKLDTQ